MKQLTNQNFSYLLETFLPKFILDAYKSGGRKSLESTITPNTKDCPAGKLGHMICGI